MVSKLPSCQSKHGSFRPRRKVLSLDVLIRIFGLVFRFFIDFFLYYATLTKHNISPLTSVTIFERNVVGSFGISSAQYEIRAAGEARHWR